MCHCKHSKLHRFIHPWNLLFTEKSFGALWSAKSQMSQLSAVPTVPAWTAIHTKWESWLKLVFFRKYCDELSCQWMPPMFLSQNCDFILSIALLSIFLQHWMFSNVALIIFHEIGQSTPKNLLLFPKDVTRMSTNPRNRFDNILCYKSIVFAKRQKELFQIALY